MDPCVIKQTSEGSFFVYFEKGSGLYRSLLSEHPKLDGWEVRVVQIAYSDKVFIAECVRGK